jgi:hypothetical protein
MMLYCLSYDTRDECLKHLLTHFTCSQMDAMVEIKPLGPGGRFVQLRWWNVLRQLTILVGHVLTSVPLAAQLLHR